MMTSIFILYFLFYVMPTIDHRKRIIEDVEKELAINGIIFILNDEGIYIPSIKMNKTMNDEINDISFTSYSNNLSYINTLHKKLDEDLINYDLDMSDKGFLNETPKEYSPINVDYDLNNRTLHSENDEFWKYTEFHDFKNINYLPNSDIMPTTYAYQLETTEFFEKDNDMTFRHDKNIDTSEHTYLTKKSKLEETTEISITPSRYNSKTSNENLYSKFLKHILLYNRVLFRN